MKRLPFQQDAFREGGPAFLSSFEIGGLFCGFVLVAFLHSGIYSVHVKAQLGGARRWV